MLLVTTPVSKDKDTGIPAWADALAAPRERKGRPTFNAVLASHQDKGLGVSSGFCSLCLSLFISQVL